jgi:hypothetical protein
MINKYLFLILCMENYAAALATWKITRAVDELSGAHGF